MASGYKYFNRDMSWLAYDKLVLETALSDDLSLTERLNFISFHSSNLDEFYSVRVAEYRKAAYGPGRVEEVSNPAAMLERINATVSEQMNEASMIVRTAICDKLRERGVELHYGTMPDSRFHTDYMRSYFEKEVIPYMQPLLLGKGTLVFLRDNRPYFAVKLHARRRSGKLNPKADYALVKLPINDLPRFIVLPNDKDERTTHVVFLDDIIRANMQELFPGYEIEGMWSIKISRDADLGISEDGEADIAEQIRDNLVNRKTGTPAGFYHDKELPKDFLLCLKSTFGFAESEMVEGGRYLNLHHLSRFPVEIVGESRKTSHTPVVPRRLQITASLIEVVEQGDFMLHYPYQSFDYVIRLFNEAARDPEVSEIKITQYRVATNSAVVNSLIAAAANNKRVTVFVELKARFDEENNLELSERMKAAGIRIIYSIPGLKVHAKVALILRGDINKPGRSIAYISTGNFNEQTARSYTDHGLFTSDQTMIADLQKFFTFLEDQSYRPEMKKLLVTKLNMEKKLHEMIGKEMDIAKAGGQGRIIMKMNGLQNRKIIDELYDASMAGVKIDLIIRGICCLVPGQSYSKNIRVIRIVDNYLEHGRVWAFGPDGDRGIYITSSDCLNRNMKRRIEAAVPIENYAIRQELMKILNLQMHDNVRARMIDENQSNCIIMREPGSPIIRAQNDIYNAIQQWS